MTSPTGGSSNPKGLNCQLGSLDEETLDRLFRAFQEASLCAKKAGLWRTKDLMRHNLTTLSPTLAHAASPKIDLSEAEHCGIMRAIS